MSSSDSVNAFAMMESVALNESHVIVDDIDYVLVETQNNDMEIDQDDSYDYCEDAVSMLSVEQHSSISVCSDLPSIDPAAFGIETKEEAKNERRPRVISFGNEEDELRIRSEKFQASIETLDERMPEAEPTLETEDAMVTKPTDSAATVVVPEPANKSAMVETSELIAKSATEEQTKPVVPVSRLSNKKRRKKMKLMKRAAAAAAAAAALSEMTTYMPTAPTLPPPSSPKPRRSKKSNSRSKSASSVAVSCATETIQSYREEVANNKKKGSSKFVSTV